MISADLIKKLRDITDASMLACKSALEKAEGNLDRAVTFLKEEGAKIAEKKSERVTGIGIVEAYVHGNQKVGVLVELRSETDFVARNPQFRELAHDIAMHIAATDPDSPETLLQQPFIKDESRTVGELVTEAIARFGENITIGRFSRFQI